MCFVAVGVLSVVTATAPAALVLNEEQALIVRSIFEMFASGRFGLVTISRSLEERRVPTRLGRPLWQRDQIKAMLRNETYAGTRYFNRVGLKADIRDCSCKPTPAGPLSPSRRTSTILTRWSA
jgi:hypothetical protein